MVDALAPGQRPPALLPWLRTQATQKTVAIVGHEPGLGSLVSWLTAGSERSFVELGKGGASLLGSRRAHRSRRRHALLAAPSQSAARRSPDGRIHGESASIAPAVQGACAVALAYLDDATAAAVRLGDGSDRGALHAFRVAMRRLRVTVRAYPGIHETVPNEAAAAAPEAGPRHERGPRRRSPDRVVQRALGAIHPAQRAAVAPFRRTASGAETPGARAGAADAPAPVRQARTQAAASLGRTPGGRGTHTRPRSGRSRQRLWCSTRASSTRVSRTSRKRRTPISSMPRGSRRSGCGTSWNRSSPVADGAPLIGRLKQLQDLFGALTDAHELEVALQESKGPPWQPQSECCTRKWRSSFDRLRDQQCAAASLERDVAAAARRLRPVAKTPRVAATAAPPASRRQSAG